MRELPGKLLQRIRLGEDNSIEFKEVTFAGGQIKGPGRNETRQVVPHTGRNGWARHAARDAYGSPRGRRANHS